MDMIDILRNIKYYHIRGVNNKNIVNLLSKRYKVRKTDIEIILMTLENTDYRWNKRAKR